MHSYINDKYQRMKQILNTFAEEFEIFIFEKFLFDVYIYCFTIGIARTVIVVLIIISFFTHSI